MQFLLLIFHTSFNAINISHITNIQFFNHYHYYADTSLGCNHPTADEVTAIIVQPENDDESLDQDIIIQH